ncbi:MAG: S1/P1 Nuclease [Acidobacteria bacterium]|nr:S1/P1 Nuclease [Acidobacteriota bacterium]
MRRLRLGAVVVLLALGAAWPHQATAWGRDGHMVIGAVAYARLRAEDPAALAAVLTALRQHPHYADLLRGPDEWALDVDDADLAIFMQASRWADDVRSGRYEEFGRSNWHYVNYHLREGRLDPPGAPERDGFLLDALKRNHARVRSNDPTERAIALTWLFHLVGDSHQPLHNIANHAPEHPNGDRGGNLFYVRVEAAADTINLHWLWDDLVIGSNRFSDVRQRAIMLRNQPGLRPHELAEQTSELDFSTWIRDGAEIAVEHVYRNGALRGGTRERGTLLPAGYTASVQPIAHERATLAGYRLARLLSDAF